VHARSSRSADLTTESYYSGALGIENSIFGLRSKR
jgi:hypothetical protein